MKLEFSRHMFQNLKYHISWKSVQWEQNFYIWVDGQTDRHDAPNKSPFANLRTRLTTVLYLSKV
jgi:hypothetical protein